MRVLLVSAEVIFSSVSIAFVRSAILVSMASFVLAVFEAILESVLLMFAAKFASFELRAIPLRDAVISLIMSISFLSMFNVRDALL